jgi:Tfp pilus assembly PilM family ATPase
VPKSENVTAILDVGTDSSNLLLSCEGALAIRSIRFGGNTISRVIAKEFNLEFEQAEKLKRNPTAVRELHRLFGVVEPRFADLNRELRRTIDGFLRSHEGGLTRFLVAGGTLKLHSALRYLWHGV